MGGYIGVKSVTQIDGYTKTEADAEFMTEAEVNALNITDENFTTADHSKLDGIEANADVTDATNVEAAGALMDSEVTNLAQVKAFDSADYATAAQGTKADTALQSYTVSESDVTGHQAALSITESQISDLNANYVVDATYVKTDENFTTADHSKLDGIEANATADQTKADIEGLGIGFSSLSATPTTVAGYGITDAYSGSFADLTSKPTTISGYGITDASTTTEMNAAISTAVGNLIDSAPTALDTLNELAASLGDDADFAGTMTTNLAGKLNLSGGALTGAVTTTSTFDGRNVSSDGAKLDGIESGATADQTKADIDALGINATSVSGFTVGKSVPSNAVFTDNDTTYSVGDGGLTQKNFTSTLKTKLDGIATNANNYTHPTFNGDDFSIDTGHLSGATVIDDLDINITTDSNGHVTDANATVGTRNLTLANLGYTGATNANNYVHPTSAGNKHIPSGGSTDQILKYSSSGTAVWADPAGGGSGVHATMLFDHKGTYTWTTPSACKVMIQAVGAGGAGGALVSQSSGSTNSSGFAQGGSGGGYARSIVDLPSGTTITMSIGEGGQGATNGISWQNQGIYAYSGNDGGNTTVTASGLTTMTANGGDGGQAVGATSSATHSAFATASAGGTASGGTEANITGTAALDLSSNTAINAKTYVFLPPGSFHSGFDNSRGLPSLSDVLAANSDSDPIRYNYNGSGIKQSWVNYARGNYFGTALNSHVRGNMPRMTGSEDHTADTTEDDGYYGTRVPGASFMHKGGTEGDGLNASAVRPGPGTYGTGSGGTIHCANGFTGGINARTADGGDGFVIITVLDI